MSNKGQVIKNEKGFSIKKSPGQFKRDAIKIKGNPTNREIADLLEQVLERLDERP